MTPTRSHVVVHQAPPASERLIHGHLDRPRNGEVSQNDRVSLVGWALGRETPVVGVEVRHKGALVQHASLGVKRVDLKSAFPDHPAAPDAGFRMVVPWSPAAAPLSLEVLAVLSGQRRVPLATVQVSAPPSISGPHVSVVIPCFNQAHYLPEALESVLAQTNLHTETVVVDDGSTDNTEPVVRKYPGVGCVSQRNRGPSAARNAGIRATTGDFLLFLDADDRLVPEAVQIGLDVLHAHPDVGASFGHHRLIDAGGALIFEGPLDCTDPNMYRALLKRNVVEMHATVLYRRSVLDQVGYFDETLPAAEDHELLLRIARVRHLRCSHQIVAEYRRHGGNATNRAARLLSASARVVRMQRPHLENHVGDNESLRAAFRSGRRFVRRYYGTPLARQVRHDLERRQWAVAWQKLLVLARHDPRGLFAFLPGGRYR